MTALLILIGDRSLSKVFFKCFWILSYNSTALTVLWKSFIRLPSVELLIWGKCWYEEITKHVLKTDGDKLFKDLLIDKIFSQQILSSNFRMELCLKKGMIWGFLGLKLTILTAFFVKLQFVE